MKYLVEYITSHGIVKGENGGKKLFIIDKKSYLMIKYSRYEKEKR